MYDYNPYDPYLTAASYTTYMPTTSVPAYTLQHNLLSLSNQQLSQTTRLGVGRLIRVRQATLHHIGAQRLREAIKEAEVVEIIESIIERDQDVEHELTEAEMYGPSCESCAERCRDILKMHKHEKWNEQDYGRELAQAKVRETLDPS
jgi:hypothetical protein